MARINPDKCVGCTKCIKFCTVDAISLVGKKCQVDEDKCVECYVCLRQKVCPHDAIEVSPLDSFYKEFKHMLSDPQETHPVTGVAGRGTEEAKTNDVTGRVRRGEVGICVDMGRPGIGTYLRDAEKVAVALCQAGVVLTPKEQSPLTALMPDPSTGKLDPLALDTHMLSVIVEGVCREENLKTVMQALQKVEKEIDTVFSLGLMMRVEPDGSAPALHVLDELGIPQPFRGKVNVGLGRPIAEP